MVLGCSLQLQLLLPPHKNEDFSLRKKDLCPDTEFQDSWESLPSNKVVSVPSVAPYIVVQAAQPLLSKSAIAIIPSHSGHPESAYKFGTLHPDFRNGCGKVL